MKQRNCILGILDRTFVSYSLIFSLTLSLVVDHRIGFSQPIEDPSHTRKTETPNCGEEIASADPSFIPVPPDLAETVARDIAKDTNGIEHAVAEGAKCPDETCERRKMGQALAAVLSLIRPLGKVVQSGVRVSTKLTQAFVQDASRTLRLEKLRSDPVYLFDFAKRLAAVYTFQSIGFAANALSQPHFLDDAPYFVFLNTLVLMLVQSEVGAEKTPILPEVHQVRTWGELRTLVPKLFQGEKGFAKESAQRLIHFAKLIPFELAVVVLVNCLQEMLANQSLGISWSEFRSIFYKNLGFVTIFGGYLALRWSVWDKVIDIGFWTAFRNVTDSEYVQKRSELLNAQGYETLGPVPSLSEYFRIWVPLKEHRGGMSLGQYLRSPLFTEKIAHYSSRRRLYRNAMKTPELKALHRSWIYRRHQLGFIAEMAYRWTNEFINAYFVFWLVGDLLKPEKPVDDPTN